MATAAQSNDRQGLLVVSDLSTLGTQGRVNIPKPLLDLVGWSLESSPVPLIAELMEIGWIRLHLESDIRFRLDEILANIRQNESPGQLEVLATAMDRYREVSFFTTTLQKEAGLLEIVSVQLGISVKESKKERRLYLEAKGRAIDIMSLSFRALRSDRLKDEISI